MKANQFWILVIAIISSLIFTSCAPTKGELSSQIGKIKIGTLSAEVLNHLQTLEIDGIKADIDNSPSSAIIEVNEEKVTAEKIIVCSFRGRGIFYSGAFAIFYFDKSDKLITYVVETIY